MSKREDFREEMRDVLRVMRKQVEKATKDVARVTQEIMGSTQQAVRDVSPKVAATLDETMKDTSAAFRKAVANLDKQTRQQQINLLRSYRSFLSKQADLVERRLKKIANRS